ncbi:hypothetical protein FHS76_000483 [Ochrobactrum daejeonense]|uniref:Uncharacterized protein n=1 Tax=Brucella daejeonensis TaxID=659015 RepID=A0A7W9AU55_9HYPH|nr:hypothetical protein [Brucella daejeonensis]
MKHNSVFIVVKQVSPEDAPRPFRVLETYVTSEGYRSRICSGAFHFQSDAQEYADALARGDE